MMARKVAQGMVGDSHGGPFGRGGACGPRGQRRNILPVPGRHRRSPRSVFGSRASAHNERMATSSTSTTSTKASTIVGELAPNIWSWRARHPDWRSTSELVASYAVRCSGGLAIIDPLLPDGDA